MKTLSKIFAALALLLALSGCTTATNEEPKVVDYGPQPENIQERTQQYIESQLKDPDSAKYRWGRVSKAWVFPGLLNGGGRWYGWVQIVEVNAKNGFGGYVGYKPYYIFFTSDGMIYDASHKLSKPGMFGSLVGD